MTMLTGFLSNLYNCSKKQIKEGATLYNHMELLNKIISFEQALLDMGVRNQSKVIVSLKRSTDCIAMMLAVINLGAIVVPVSAGCKQSRLRKIERTIQSDVAITKEFSKKTEHQAQFIFREPKLGDVLFILHTSGTTGEPKPIQLTYENLSNCFNWMKQEFQLDSNSIVLQKTSLDFDVFLWEVFLTLSCGSKLVLYDKPYFDAEDMLKTIQKEEVTHVDLVPSILTKLVEQAEFVSLRSLEYLLCGGEVLSSQLARQVIELLPRVQLYNLYGPAECTLQVAYHRVTKADIESTVPIGKPTPNAAIHLLGPEGDEGEIIISGSCVTKGFHTSGYPTGDLGRRNKEGELEYVGRIDDQVKINGIRVNPSLIEAKIKGYPNITDVFVTMEEKKFVAHCACTDNDTMVSDIKKYLASHLDPILIPDVIKLHDALPLSSTGKIDRSAITAKKPKPDTDKANSLAKLFSCVLGVEDIKAHNNFFEYGASSLDAMTLLSHLRKEYGSNNIPLKWIYEERTPEKLLQRIETTLTGSSKFQLKKKNRMTLPLSPVQEQLWYHMKRYPNSLMCNMTLVTEVVGDLDLDSLRKAYHSVVKTYPELNMTILEEEGKPYQYIHNNTPTGFRYFKDVSISEGKALYNKYSVKTIDLTKECAFQLIVIDHGKHKILISTLSHLCGDGSVFPRILTKLSTYYQHLLMGEACQIIAAPFDFLDYVYSLECFIKSTSYQAQLEYWVSQVEDQAYLLTFSSIKNYTADCISHRACEAFKIDASAFGLAESEFNILFSAFTFLIVKYTGQINIMVGTVISNRHYADTAELIGPMMNMLPIPSHISAEDTVASFLARRQAKWIEHLHHQDVSFEHIVNAISPERTNHHPLIQTLFILQNNLSPSLVFPQCKSENRVLNHLGEGLWLVCQIERVNEFFEVRFEYAPDRLSKQTVQSMCEYYKGLISQFLHQKSMALKQFSILSPDDYHKLVYEWNRTKDYSQEGKTITTQLVSHFHHHAYRIAIYHKGQKLTYGELSQQVSTILSWIQCETSLGDPIAVQLPPSAYAIATLLAIWISGRVYVPIPMDISNTRQNGLITKARARLILREEGIVKMKPVDNPVVEFGPGKLAYILFTSGTTGEPKGVMIPRTALETRIRWLQEHNNFESTDVVLQMAPYCFDASFEEIFVPLCSGASCVIHQPMTGMGLARSVVKHIILYNVTVISIIPSLLRELLNERQFEQCVSLRIVASGGERLPTETANLFFNDSQARLFNFYGPTETCINAIACEVSAGEASVAIGRPIADTQAYVLDAFLQPVPFEVTGEIYIGGEGLGLGYIDEAGLTKKNFIQSPFNKDQLLYKTGDMAYWSKEEMIHYIGRCDNQVNIHGVRVELEEISSYLMKHPHISHTHTLSIREKDRPLICSFVLYSEEGNLTEERLLFWLGEHLPHYMLPKQIHIVKKMPYLPSGKVDEKSLLAQYHQSQHRSNTSRTLTHTEKCIGNILKTLLTLETVRHDDNFYYLGGTSILSLSFINLLASQTGIDLSPEEVIYLTVEQIAMKKDNVGARLEATQVHSHVSYYHMSLGKLFIREYLSLSSDSDLCIILCYPLAKDYFDYYPFYTQLAKELMQKNIPVIRFDYYAQGDSSGDTRSSTAQTCLASTQSILNYALNKYPMHKMILVGGCHGANIALHAAAQFKRIYGVAVWSPILASNQHHSSRYFGWWEDRCAAGEQHFLPFKSEKYQELEHFLLLEIQGNADLVSINIIKELVEWITKLSHPMNK